MVAITPTISPPAPIPWTARNMISSAIECDWPASAEPTRKITIAAMRNLLRPILVAELAVERRRDRRCEHVRGDDPGQVRHAAQVADDVRQRRAHDQLVEHGKRHREHQRGQHEQDLPARGLSAVHLAVHCHGKLPAVHRFVHLLAVR